MQFFGLMSPFREKPSHNSLDGRVACGRWFRRRERRNLGLAAMLGVVLAVGGGAAGAEPAQPGSDGKKAVNVPAVEHPFPPWDIKGLSAELREQARVYEMGSEAPIVDPSLDPSNKPETPSHSYFAPKMQKIVRRKKIPKPPARLLSLSEIEDPITKPAEHWHNLMCLKWDDGCVHCERNALKDTPVCQKFSELQCIPRSIRCSQPGDFTILSKICNQLNRKTLFIYPGSPAKFVVMTGYLGNDWSYGYDYIYNAKKVKKRIAQWHPYGPDGGGEGEILPAKLVPRDRIFVEENTHCTEGFLEKKLHHFVIESEIYGSH